MVWPKAVAAPESQEIAFIRDDRDQLEHRRRKMAAFTAENKMVWPRYLDRERRVQRAFEVRALPTCVLIAHEGIVRFRAGIGSGALKDAIRKQVKLAA